MEDGKLPLKGELFARKSVVGRKLEEFREEKRADALTSRQNTVGGQKWILRRSNRVYWGIAAMFILLFGTGTCYFASEEKITSEAVAVDYRLPDGSSVKLIGLLRCDSGQDVYCTNRSRRCYSVRYKIFG